MFLYLNEGDWRGREFKSTEPLDLDLCLEADLVVEFSDGRFFVHKDRWGTNDFAVPVTEEGSNGRRWHR